MPSRNFLNQDEHGNQPSTTASHAKVHQGLLFSNVAYQAGASVLNVLITAPSDINYHLVAAVVITGPAHITWSKTPNHDSTGQSIITGYNHNEDSPNQSTLVVAKGGINTSVGTILDRVPIGAATGPGDNTIIGGNATHDEEWVLGKSSVHLIQVIPGASCETVIRCTYYKKE